MAFKSGSSREAEARPTDEGLPPLLLFADVQSAHFTPRDSDKHFYVMLKGGGRRVGGSFAELKLILKTFLFPFMPVC